ncbi:uncharacterized protein LOC133037824 [Cannabis sativa]|uniref:uncharacterized protein LOC133037824 n=1 Tax=Cannabis sativa TaxID=3483 RepID=UPI0029CA4992|nr:uncharacterized protein LOC133037824 [Cannabis sativa]
MSVPTVICRFTAKASKISGRKKRAKCSESSSQKQEILQLKKEIEELKKKLYVAQEQDDGNDNSSEENDDHLDDHQEFGGYEDDNQTPPVMYNFSSTNNNEVLLCSDNIHNIVAKGVLLESVSPVTIHTVQYKEGIARVLITEQLQEEAEIAHPIENIRYVYETKDTFFPWPKHLILNLDKVPIFPDVASTHKSSSKGKQIATPHRSPNKGKQISTLPAMSSAGSQSNVRIEQMDKNATFKPEVWAQIPVCLHFLVEEFIRRKGKWSVVEVPTDPDFMPPRTHIILSSEDVEQVGTLNFIGCQGMIFGIRCIWEDLTNMREYFKFFDPELLNATDKDGIVHQEVVIKLAEWLNTMNNKSQMFFIPWNYERHWMLEIVCAGKIIHLDPWLRHKRPKMTIDLTLQRAYELLGGSNELLGIFPGVTVAACPKQTLGIECGFYVLRYINDIVKALNSFVIIREKFGKMDTYDVETMLLPLQHQWLSKLTRYLY